MTTLRFKAKDGHAVILPGSVVGKGVRPEYVGRKFDYDKGEYIDHVHVFDADSAFGQRLMADVMKWDCLECADETTAVACGKIAAKEPESLTTEPGPDQSGKKARRNQTTETETPSGASA